LLTTKRSEVIDLSSLNLSESSIHANALPNGLFLDVDYYMQTSEPTITIGRYGSVTNAPVTGYEIYTLIREEFYTLHNKKWIDGKIIDCYTILLLNSISHKCVYVPTNYTYYMIGDHYQTSKNANWRMYNISQSIDGIMLLPYCIIPTGIFLYWILLTIQYYI